MMFADDPAPVFHWCRDYPHVHTLVHSRLSNPFYTAHREVASAILHDPSAPWNQDFVVFGPGNMLYLGGM